MVEGNQMIAKLTGFDVLAATGMALPSYPTIQGEVSSTSTPIVNNSNNKQSEGYTPKPRESIGLGPKSKSSIGAGLYTGIVIDSQRVIIFYMY